MVSSPPQDRPIPLPNPRRRWRIGLLIDEVEGDYERPIWQSVAKVAQQRNCDLVILVTGILESPYNSWHQCCIVSQMVDAQGLDGLVFTSASIFNWANEAMVADYCKPFASLPVVCIGKKIQSHPVVMADNVQGFRDSLAHLADHHGCRRIGLVSGPLTNSDARIRHQVFLDFMRDRGIPLDPTLISFGDFTYRSGPTTTAQLMSSPLPLDAIVYANDDMASGGIEYLRSIGKSIPFDMRVTGFDDAEAARGNTPPLTTVSQDIEEQARMAAELLIAMLTGEQVPDTVTIPSRAVIRESCGCLAVQQETPRGDQGLEDTIIRRMEEVAIREGDQGGFDRFLFQELSQRMDEDSDLIALHQRILDRLPNILEECDSTTTRDKAIETVNRTCLMIGRIMGMHGFRERRNHLISIVELRRSIHEHIVSHSRENLLASIEHALLELKIKTCYLVLYEGGGFEYDRRVDRLPAHSSLVMAIEDGGVAIIPPDRARFPTKKLLPDMVWGARERSTYVLRPLFFQKEHYGYLLFENSLADFLYYESIRVQISSALRGALLMEAKTKLEQQARRALCDLEQANQELQRATDSAREANLAKSQFLASMSHELRTPLNAILGFTQVLLRDADLDDQTHYSLDRIHHAGEHLLGLINDVLSISKIEAGKITLTSSPFRIRQMIRGVYDLFALRASEKGLNLRSDIAEDVADVYLGDEGKLRQVVINLLGNAVKFTSRGFVSLRITHVLDRLRFEVRDTGPGLRPEEMQGLFSAFHQTEAGAKTREGTGLGLYISQSIIRTMGGEIAVQSNPEEGSVFSFELRLQRLEDRDLHPLQTRQVEGLASKDAGTRVLVVDDRADNRDFLAELLRQWGFDVRIAEDGLDCIETWRLWKPRIIWMDLHMPKMGGIEATGVIRELERIRGMGKTVIIALSANALDIERKMLIERGFDEFMLKPFHEHELVEVLERAGGIRFSN